MEPPRLKRARETEPASGLPASNSSDQTTSLPLPLPLPVQTDNPFWWYQTMQSRVKKKSHLSDLQEAQRTVKDASAEQKGRILSKAIKDYKDYHSFQEFKVFWQLCSECMPCPVTERLKSSDIKKMAKILAKRIQTTDDCTKTVPFVRMLFQFCASGQMSALIDRDLPPNFALLGLVKELEYFDGDNVAGTDHSDEFISLCLVMLENEFHIDLYESLRSDPRRLLYLSEYYSLDLMESLGLNNSRFLFWAIGCICDSEENIPFILSQFLTHFDLIKFEAQYGKDKETMEIFEEGLETLLRKPLSPALAAQLREFLQKFGANLSRLSLKSANRAYLMASQPTMAQEEPDLDA